MNDGLADATLLAATLTSGLLAGLFYAYSVSVMRGLRLTVDRTFVEAMQRINVAILNGWFALDFVGAPLFTTLAVVAFLGEGDLSAMTWVGLAWPFSALTLVITFAASVPLNDELASATAADATVARRHFEVKWVRWNLARTVSSTTAFGCLVLALLVHG